METHAHTERGGSHENNEDFVLRKAHSSGHGRKLCFLADGQGGRLDGAEASQAACQGAMSFANHCSWEDLLSPSIWDRIFEAADQSVRSCCEGFTTLIGLVCAPGQIFGASVGDSKVFYLPADDGQVQEMTERQRKNPPVGAGVNQATCFSIPDFKGTLLVVSDGVWKFAGWEAMIKSAGEDGDLLTIPDKLRSEVLSQQTGDQLPDDFSVITIRS